MSSPRLYLICPKLPTRTIKLLVVEQSGITSVFSWLIFLREFCVFGQYVLKVDVRLGYLTQNCIGKFLSAWCISVRLFYPCDAMCKCRDRRCLSICLTFHHDPVLCQNGSTYWWKSLPLNRTSILIFLDLQNSDRITPFVALYTVWVSKFEYLLSYSSLSTKVCSTTWTMFCSCHLWSAAQHHWTCDAHCFAAL